MASLNKQAKGQLRTHEGAPAKAVSAEAQLRRSVMSCLLWEKEFYEDGQEIATRIAELCTQVTNGVIATIAIEAREVSKLRHVPLLLVREMARRGGSLVAKTLERVIQRADEMTEFLAIYWADGKVPLSAQVKKGLARAFTKFDAYQLAKYNRDGAVKLRDVLFLTHAKPRDEEQEQMWKQLVEGNLPTPDTWEVELSASKDKRASWSRLLGEHRLGGLALLRNLRNMQQASVDEDLIRAALGGMNTSRILPFRFIAAARYAPRFEPELEAAMFSSCATLPKLAGKTILLVDHSWSMLAALSEKSDMTRFDAAAGLAMVAREVCEHVQVFSFSDRIEEVPPRRGFALRDAIVASNQWSGTYLGLAVSQIDMPHDRLIVITDEQTGDPVPDPPQRTYMINVASARNGVGYYSWTHLDGFSENIVRFIAHLEG